MNTAHEIDQLRGKNALLFGCNTFRNARSVEAIKTYGCQNSDGKYSIAYGILFDKTANICEFKFPNKFGETRVDDEPIYSRSTERYTEGRQASKKGLSL
jgi:hypothetical protein